MASSRGKETEDGTGGCSNMLTVGWGMKEGIAGGRDQGAEGGRGSQPVMGLSRMALHGAWLG